MTSETKLVQWLGSGDPPAQLSAHLKSRGLVLSSKGPAQTSSPARLTQLPTSTAKVERPSLAGRRVAVLHPDPGSADLLAQALRKAGGTVLVLSLNPSALHRAESFDADAVLVEAADFIGGCWEIVRALWTHPRLRWAPIVLTPDERSALSSLSAPESDLMCQFVQELSAPYEALLKQVAARAPFELSLQTLGPARTLRALAASGTRLRMCVESSAHIIEIDLAENILVGAQELDPEEPSKVLLGSEALAHVLSLDQARASVKSVTSPATTNVMTTLEEAMQAARAVSIRPPSQPTLPAYIARRQSQRPNNDAIPTVRPPQPTPEASQISGDLRIPPPNAARVYPLRPSLPTPPVPRQAEGVAAPRPIPVPRTHTVDNSRHVASAAALNLESPVPASVATVLPENVVLGLESGVLATAQEELSNPWDLHEQEELRLSEQAADAQASGVSRFKALVGNNLLPKVRKRLEPARAWLLQSQAARPARQWLSKAHAYLGKPTPQTMIIAVLVIAVIAVLIRGQASTDAAKAPVNNPGKELRVRVQKLPPEPAVAAQPSPAEVEEEVTEEVGSKPASRRASELVSEGHALRHEGKLTEAQNAYREALRVYPGYPRAFAGLAHLAIEQGDGTAAVRYARLVVRARPQQGASHLLLGDAQRAAGNIPAAKSAWKAAAKRGDRTAKNRLK